MQEKQRRTRQTTKQTIHPEMPASRPPGGASKETRLIPALPKGPFVVEPAEVDRFMVQVLPDGTLFFKGSRERIEEFIAACKELGLDLSINSIALCG